MLILESINIIEAGNSQNTYWIFQARPVAKLSSHFVQTQEERSDGTESSTKHFLTSIWCLMKMDNFG